VTIPPRWPAPAEPVSPSKALRFHPDATLAALLLVAADRATPSALLEICEGAAVSCCAPPRRSVLGAESPIVQRAWQLHD